MIRKTVWDHWNVNKPLKMKSCELFCVKNLKYSNKNIK